MKKNKTVPIVLGLIVIAVVVVGILWGKSYYDNRYAGTDYYTMIPLSENMDTTTIYSAAGEDVGQGKEYKVTGYDSQGNAKVLEWTMMADKGSFYPPGTYLLVSSSSEIVLEQEVIAQSDVPENIVSLIEKS